MSEPTPSALGHVLFMFPLPNFISPSWQELCPSHPVVEWWSHHHSQYSQCLSAGVPPFQCLLVYQLPLFPCPCLSGELSEATAIHHWFQESEMVWNSEHHQLQRAIQWQKIYADAGSKENLQYHTGQKWLSSLPSHPSLLSLSSHNSALPGSQAHRPRSHVPQGQY